MDWVLETINTSLRDREIAAALKLAAVHPLLKKSTVVPKELNKYNPFSNYHP